MMTKPSADLRASEITAQALAHMGMQDGQRARTLDQTNKQTNNTYDDCNEEL